MHQNQHTGNCDVLQCEYTIIDKMILTIGRSRHLVCIKSVKGKLIKKHSNVILKSIH